MIDIQKVTQKAIEQACKTEQLPDFNRKDAASLETLRKRNYPTNRGLKEYYGELPMLQSLISDKTSMLDIGTGNGLALAEIVEKNKCFAIGTGIRLIHNHSIVFSAAEGSFLPFKNDVFDLVTSVQGISWVPDQHKAIEEAVRVLKPGGYCLLNLIKFSASVEIWYGDEFWKSIDVDKQEFMREYDFREAISLPNTEMKVRKIPMEGRMYKHKYYVECIKLM